MKRPHPGQLGQSFNIECGMCKHYTINGIAHPHNGMAYSRAEAAAALRAEGWARTRAWGWICPRCDKHGSAGVVPAPGRDSRELFEAGQKIAREGAKS